MPTTLEEELSALKQKLLLMGSRVEEAIRLSVKSIVSRDNKLARVVIQSDRDIDDMEMDIDETCHRLLALFQPTAGDMRFVTSCMKINSNLERMGDLAADISERALTVNEVEPLKPYVDIPLLAAITQEMLKSSLDSLVNRDPELARKVRARDTQVDELNDQLIRVLISYMLDNRAVIKQALDLILISRYLERIADHAVNISTDVIYLVEGKDLRHQEVVSNN
jgi:phosphate transport system protein